MRTKRFALLAAAALAALALVGAPSAAYAADPIIVDPATVTAPVQNLDDGTFELPEVEGIFYGIYEYETETYVVASTWGHPGYRYTDPATGYRFTEWVFPNLGTAAHPFVIDPGSWTANDECGFVNDAMVRVPSEHESKIAASWGQWNSHHTQAIGTASTGIVDGVHYSFAGVTPDANGNYVATTALGFQPFGC